MLSLIADVNLQTELKLNSSGTGVGEYYETLSVFFKTLLPIAFIGAGIIFLFLLIGGGFSIIASGGNAKNVEQGKNQILQAVIGFLVIFASYWIVQVIEIMTGLTIFGG